MGCWDFMLGEASALGGLCPGDASLHTLMSRGMPASIRACLMDYQDGWAADDQIAFTLTQLAANTGARVIDPLQATQAIAARCASSLPAMPRALAWVCRCCCVSSVCFGAVLFQLSRFFLL